MKRSLFRIFIIGLICWGSLSGAVRNERDVHVLSYDDRSCVVTFFPQRFQVDSLVLNNKSYQRIHFRLAGFEGEPGDPQIPCRVLVVGIPQRGDVRVTVTSTEFVERQGIRLPPASAVKREDGISSEKYEEGILYRQSGFIPGRLFETEEPAFWGDRRIIRIKVFPVQFDPSTNRIQEYTSITFRVDFEIPGEDVRERGGERFQPVYKNILVNYPQAAKWRLPRDRRLRKRRMFMTGGIYKIPIFQEGIYRVSGSFLDNQGIDIGAIQPSTIKIYNNGGRELPRALNAQRPDSLIENPIVLIGMEDGRFDTDDAIVFYGKGVTGWEYDADENRYEHYINHYTDRNVYWLVFNDGQEGRRIETVSPVSSPITRTLSTFRDRIFLEQEITNHLKGGIHWGGQLFTAPTSEETYTPSIRDPVSGDTLRFRFQFMGAASGLSQFRVRFNDQSVTTVQFYGPSQEAGPRIFLPPTSVAELTGVSYGQDSNLSFAYQGFSQGAKAYLDWYEIEYLRYLRAYDGRLRFYSAKTEGVYEYQLSGFSAEPWVLDVTDFSNIRRMTLTAASGGWAFIDSVQTNEPRDYMASESSAFLSPQLIQLDAVSNLRDPANGADLVIISHADFYDQALRLQSLRQDHDSLSVFVTDIEEVYDAFAWGLPDPVAIRDFMSYAYANWAVRPSYLLLLGDGDYDYRNIESDNDKNWIPPFEYDGLTESGSRASDDWYAYVHGQDSKMDLSVGRIPVQSTEEARTVVDKIISYETNPDWGDWRSLITMVGDDEKAGTGDENEITHTRATEDIAENIIPPLFNFKKIYLTEYPEEITVEGRQKSGARDNLLEQINRGTLLVNFIGHGNEHLWTHERVFDRQTALPLLENDDRLPFYYAATCAFGLYDDPDEQSFTEDLINSEGGGGIGVVSASRFCSASANEALNKAFMDYLFSDQGPTLRLGDAMRMAKLSTTSTVNNEMYHIFGDPTMRLGVPRYHAVITKIEPDTLKALSLIKVDGRIEKDGVEWTDFQGNVSVKAFDSKKDVVYETQYGTTLSYRLPGNALFRGEAEAENGQFQVSFIMPKDIFYGGHTGRISCYFWDEEIDGGGYEDDIEVGGSGDVTDSRGPEITLFFEGLENFVTGGMVPEDPELIADIQDDSSGINITGEIGHKIILTLNDEENTDVTEYFQYDEDSYLGGKVRYRLSEAGKGEHSLSLKAWDNANNSSMRSIVFRVIPGNELRIEEVLNYPNPFSPARGTHFTFKLSQDAEVEIKVFTVDGRLIKRFEHIFGEPGFNIVPSDPNEGWDGTDDMGDELANGVYLYKIIAKAYTGEKTLQKEVIGRLMVMR